MRDEHTDIPLAGLVLTDVETTQPVYLGLAAGVGVGVVTLIRHRY